ncbi:MAG TPA: dTDP-4-amino-4,6-dideoxygalactose transaminase [Cyclobacteriaceae bacterium]|jgi:dTDP-4-amino-4,6-dideoxygalactose transaminase|nr:dTDP-4-amino-4,6-dideoxygalactose transaminase [Cyclobacteriaceae bacterium]
MNKIGFNKPFLTGSETVYINQAVLRKHTSGNGHFTHLCHQFFEKKYKFKKCLLTTSCTDALEMCAILLDIQPGDEVIMPSYTFVSTANAFVLRGAKIIFADSLSSHPNIDAASAEQLITVKTKAIVVVHYGGVACDMGAILATAKKHNLFVVEDAAQSIDSYYHGRPLGSLGHLAAFSFHETKNIISGEGGMLVVNDDRFEKRADIIWEKGTNRKAFFSGEVDKYSWVDIGSSFLASEITAAFLYAQLEKLEMIQTRRKRIWENYNEGLRHLAEEGRIRLPFIPSFATNNGHLFYIICETQSSRDKLINHLRNNGIYATFHYLPLHLSPFYKAIHGNRRLLNCEHYGETIIRLPFYYELSEPDQLQIMQTIGSFFE